MTVALAGDTLHLDGPITAECRQAWRDAYVSSRIADSVWFPDQLSSFHGRFRRRTLLDLVLVDVEADPFGTRYTTGSPVAGYLGVSVNTRRFTERVVFGNRSEVVVTSSVDLWDAGMLAESEVLSPMAQTILLVPKAALHLPTSGTLLPPDAPSDQERAALRLLRRLVLAVAADAHRFGDAAAGASRNAIVELLLCIVQERRRPPGAAVSESMRLSVTRWVDENLHLGQLSPTQAAEQHGISVRSLHRLFADSGDSFGSVVRRRRLERACRDLQRTDDMVQSIAMRWGYADASQFINEFKRAHGTTPAAYRKTSRTSG